MRRLLPLLLLLALLAGCEAQTVETALAPTPAPARTYALVAKDVVNPYMQTMFDGFRAACDELGAEALLCGPEVASAAEQANLVRELADRPVDAIAIAANDRDALSDALKYAIGRGVPVVSLDSAVDPGDRMVHVQQASPEVIGRVLMQASHQILGGAGQVAILTTTKSAPNQAAWVRWMLTEVEENPEKYRDMPIVEIAYGLDEDAASRQVTRELIAKYPDLKLIVAPTSAGMYAAAKAIAEAGSGVRLTGLGLPSDLEPYVASGLCPFLYLWNPIDVGYLAAYAADALVRGEITGAVGEIFRAGDMGDKLITQSEDGGSEVVLGNPSVFDADNISVWSEVF